MSIQAPASARPAVATGVVAATKAGYYRWYVCGAALLCVGHQLHRPPGHRHPQADAAAAVRLERARLRRHRVFVPARVRDRVSVRRPADGSPRHPRRVRDCDRHLESSRRWRTRGSCTSAARSPRCWRCSGSPTARRSPGSWARGLRSDSARPGTFRAR